MSDKTPEGSKGRGLAPSSSPQGTPPPGKPGEKTRAQREQAGRPVKEVTGDPPKGTAAEYASTAAAKAEAARREAAKKEAEKLEAAKAIAAKAAAARAAAAKSKPTPGGTDRSVKTEKKATTTATSSATAAAPPTVVRPKHPLKTTPSSLLLLGGWEVSAFLLEDISLAIESLGKMTPEEIQAQHRALTALYASQYDLLKRSNNVLSLLVKEKEKDEIKLESKLRQLKAQSEACRNTSDKALLVAAQLDDASLNARKAERLDLDESIGSNITTIEIYIEQLKKKAKAEDKRRAKLPDLPFEQFDGNVLKYPAFIDMWRSLYGNRKDLEDVEKFRYLLKNTKEGSEARKSIQNLPVTHESYKIALSTLESRFGKNEIVVACFQKKLETIQVAQYSPGDLRRVFDGLKHCFDILTVYKAPPESPHIVNRWIEKLPLESARAWYKYKKENPTHETPRLFLEWLESYVIQEETLNLTRHISSLSKPPDKESKEKREKHPKPGKAPAGAGEQESGNRQAAFLATSGKPQGKRFSGNRKSFAQNSANREGSSGNKANQSRRFCIACQSTAHTAAECGSFKKLTVSERWSLCKEKVACLGCLVVGHRLRQCFKRKQCPKCNYFHHPLLHSDTKANNQTET